MQPGMRAQAGAVWPARYVPLPGRRACSFRPGLLPRCCACFPCSRRSVFELVGGTCGSALVLGVPGALLIQYASQKAAESRRLLSGEPPPLSAVGPQQPLLGEDEAAAAAGEAAEEGSAGSGSGGQGAAGEPYSVWRSKLFWAGVALELLAAFVFGLTVARALS